MGTVLYLPLRDDAKHMLDAITSIQQNLAKLPASADRDQFTFQYTQTCDDAEYDPADPKYAIEQEFANLAAMFHSYFERSPAFGEMMLQMMQDILKVDNVYVETHRTALGKDGVSINEIGLRISTDPELVDAMATIHVVYRHEWKHSLPAKPEDDEFNQQFEKTIITFAATRQSLFE